MDKSESAMEGVDEDAHKQWCLTSFSVIFKKEDLSKEVDLKQVWKEEVEAVFEQHGVSCKLNWGEGLMIVSGTERTTDPEIISRGVRALYVLACGLGTEYVEPIVSGEIHCDYIPITIPDGMSEDDFSSKYTDFINKFERKFELSLKLSCFVLYRTAVVVVLSDFAKSTFIVRNLVESCLNEDDPFDEDHFHELFLDDV